MGKGRCIPEGYRGALIITWDYELQKAADVSISGRKNWGMDDYTETEKLLEVLEDYSIKCTFFCLGYAAMGDELPYFAAKQIREISEMGHEIGSHSFNHENILKITYEELKETLTKSKQALEGVIDKPVISFAPPYNYPFQYLKKLAVGKEILSKEARRRLEISDVAKALYETGFETYRVSYTALIESIKRRLFGIRRLTHNIETIQNIYCFRLGCCGFTECAREAVEEAVRFGRVAVIYAHPHSLKVDNPQNIENLIPFLEYVSKLRSQGMLWIATQKETYEHMVLANRYESQ